MRQISFRPSRAAVVCGIILFQVACGATLAWSAEAPGGAPLADPAQDVMKDNGPFGGCEPIGMTASGELVFPLECKPKIKVPAAPVATEEKAPVVDDKPVAAADTRPRLSDDTLAVQTAVAQDKTADPAPVVEAKAAAVVEDKPAAAAVVDSKPVAAPETLAAADRMALPAGQKPVEVQPAAQAAAAQPVTIETPAKRPSRHAAAPDAGKLPAIKPAAGKSAAGKSAVARPAAKQVVAMAKPVPAVVTSAHAEEKPTVQTASLPACAHFRSYNAASKSYRGFDGHMYPCR